MKDMGLYICDIDHLFSARPEGCLVVGGLGVT